MTPPIQLEKSNLVPRSEEPPTSVLFVCNSNCARSKIAEGFGTSSASLIVAASAGLTPGDAVNPRASAALSKHGVSHTLPPPKSLLDPDLAACPYDYIVFLCDCCSGAALNSATSLLREGGTILSWGVDPPSRKEGGFDEAAKQIKTEMIKVGWLTHTV